MLNISPLISIIFSICLELLKLTIKVKRVNETCPFGYITQRMKSLTHCIFFCSEGYTKINGCCFFIMVIIVKIKIHDTLANDGNMFRS